jgi:DNA-binding LacI/PurR family transcriptional regulator
MRGNCSAVCLCTASIVRRLLFSAERDNRCRIRKREHRHNADRRDFDAFHSDCNHDDRHGAYEPEIIRTRIVPIVFPALARFEFFREFLFRTVSQVTINYRNCALNEALAAHGVAGMMLVGARHAAGLYELLQAKKIPFVNTWVLDSGHPCVAFDNREIGRALASHLLDLGHVEFGVIAQITGNSDRAAGRVIGIREALAARGVALPQERLIECPHKITEGQLALRALMQSSKRPTAVICGTDVLAFGPLIEARQLGVAVPRDLSIAGVNDAEFAAHLTPPLTTMRLPADEIGTRAAEYLLGSVNSLSAAATQVQVSLIVRAPW